MPFLPMTSKEVESLGWSDVDFVYVSGDAYVDHPSFGAAIITRVLEAKGFKVAFLSQPDWHTKNDFMRFGRPRLGFMVSSGNIDSMVAHYTAALKPRTDDAYTPGGKHGKRPDRAVTVYCKRIREAYPDVPIVIGGLEASLRRFAHYDYWDNEIKPSILVESGADLLIFGMGENQTIEIAERLNKGEKISEITDVKGTCYLVPVKDTPLVGAECPSLDNVISSKREYAVSCRIQQDEQDHIRGKLIKQRHGKMMLVQNPPMPPLTTEELDWVYSLPYMRTYHPSYEKFGGVPGIEEVRFSITHNRGCFGACNFCSLAFHQGRFITSRSKESLVREAKLITEMPGFKGYIHDVGGPTANFRFPSCEKQLKAGLCKGKKCLAPKPCSQLVADHSEYVDILRTLREIPKVKKVFIRSGIRYDYLLSDKDDTFFKELVKNHVSGQLKVAPEHCSASVLDYMGKPHIEAYIEFSKRYFELTESVGKEQYLVPYLMSSHPGSTLDDAVELAVFLKSKNIRPEQVQDFYPTPGTISTCMFYTELDPYTMEKVFVAKTPHDKALQRALLQYYNPRNADLCREALVRAKRTDLIGSGPNCLVPQKPGAQKNLNAKNRKKPVSHKSTRYDDKTGKPIRKRK
ncbi:MAG: YgiQ family radical SAM protein [Oscillospiraceae bacterium]|nr:YgiQ family radical SAM protein [Oscillospiraceae bacterium]